MTVEMWFFEFPIFLLHMSFAFLHIFEFLKKKKSNVETFKERRREAWNLIFDLFWKVSNFEKNQILRFTVSIFSIFREKWNFRKISKNDFSNIETYTETHREACNLIFYWFREFSIFSIFQFFGSIVIKILASESCSYWIFLFF